MPFIEAASLIGKNGFAFTAPSGTPYPEDWETADLVAAATGTDPLTSGSGTPAEWDFIGAMSRDNLPTSGNDGGDTDVKGSWDGLISRVVQTAASIDYLDMNPWQFDSKIMSMYWGLGKYNAATKVFTVTTVGGTPLERAYLLIVADGPARIGLHAWKASFSRSDSYALSTEDFTEWPVRATWLNYAGTGQGDGGMMNWLGIDDGDVAEYDVAPC